MTTLLASVTARSYLGEADLTAIVHLINTTKAFDNLDEFTSVAELQHEFASPDLNVELDLRLWHDARGELCAFAQCWIHQPSEVQAAYLWFTVRPDMRESEVETELFAWAEARLAAVAQAHQLPAQLRTGTRDHQASRIQLLQRQGFTSDRCFYRMARSLAEPIPTPQLPAGFTVRPLQGEVAAWVEMFNQSFIDHWNFHPLTVADRNHSLTESTRLPELDLVAVAPDGTFAAFCHCLIQPEENDRTGNKDGWIADLGTRRGFRRIGLGRAMLLTGLHALQAKGMQTALLGVDSENPSGALKLYQSVGFQQCYTSVAYVKQVLI